ncbi:hypothetical protein AY600_04600 [Phormidium willei BDU 130791]|nr:hypothetical protein AY600_04600 [Phormidium willei BDU 130791]
MAMRQHRFTALGLALALVLGACGPDEQDFSAPDPDETPVAEQAPTDTTADAPANGEEDIPEAEPFESPIVEEDEATMAAPSGLISSTNPQERSRQVQRNLDAARDDGADPFGILPVEVSRSQRQAETVTQQVTEEPEPGATDTGNGGRTGNGQGTQRTNGTNGGAPGTPTAGPGGQTVDAAAVEPPGPPLPPLPMQTLNPLPDLPFESAATPRFAPEPTPVPQVPQTPPTPPPPTADTAEAIEVSGVMQIGDEVQIILRTPGSVNSQYVRIGQNIAGGRVVVRRVENLATGSPLVILEENGIEVARAVGDAPVTSVGDEDNGNGRSDFIRQVPSSDLSSGTRTLAPPPQLESQYVVSQQ